MSMSPAEQHRRRVQAQQAASAATVEAGSAYELLLQQLAQHKRELKSIKSFKQKNERKKQLLEEWRDYLAALQQQENIHDPYIAGQLLIWLIDADEHEEALQLLQVMRREALPLPAHFERDLEDAFVEEMAEAWLGHEAPQITAAILQKVADLSQDWNLLDEVRAKLLRALGEAYAQQEEDARALPCLEQALQFNPKVGCKPLLQKIQKRLEASKPSA